MKQYFYLIWPLINIPVTETKEYKASNKNYSFEKTSNISKQIN